MKVETRTRTIPSLELHLSRDVFVTGRNLSGVVVLRLNKPTSIRSLAVAITGCETLAGLTLARALRRRSSFFYREVLLSGREQPRIASEKLSLSWNALLGRDSGHMLAAGEHIYPFSFALPASLPPNYDGRAGKIDYRVTATIQMAKGRRTKAYRSVPIVFIPRNNRNRPMAISYPTAHGTVHSTDVSINLQLPHRAVGIGKSLKGNFTINNPQGIEIPKVTVSLENCEWVRLAEERELHRDCIDSYIFAPDKPDAQVMESKFKLTVPESVSPSIEGTAISVIWLLRMSLDTTPPLEVKTPITVYAPLPEHK